MRPPEKTIPHARDTSSPITVRNQRESPLLRLPAELRNNIYEHVLYHGQIEVCTLFTRKYRTNLYGHAHYPTHLLRLLQVCQQTYSETRTLTFNVNELSGDYDVAPDYLENGPLSQDQKCAIKTIFLRSWDHYRHVSAEGQHRPKLSPYFGQAFAHLRSVKGLQKLVICHEHLDPTNFPPLRICDSSSEGDISMFEAVQAVFDEAGFAKGVILEQEMVYI